MWILDDIERIRANICCHYLMRIGHLLRDCRHVEEIFLGGNWFENLVASAVLQIYIFGINFGRCWAYSDLHHVSIFGGNWERNEQLSPYWRNFFGRINLKIKLHLIFCRCPYLGLISVDDERNRAFITCPYLVGFQHTRSYCRHIEEIFFWRIDLKI